MKNALVILIGLAVAGIAGYETYRIIDILQPEATEQVLYDSSAAFSSAMASATQNASANEDLLTNILLKGGDAPEYTDYEDGVIGNGKKIVLYFRSPEDGSSVQSDRELISLYSAGTATVSTYHVEYESFGVLRRKYRVRDPNTFVLLDENGEVLKSITDPAPKTIEELVTERFQVSGFRFFPSMILTHSTN